MSQLLTPVRIGRVVAPNRVLMAPMTRSRASEDGVVGDMTVAYYACLLYTSPSPRDRG